jgi:hypothetical protein
VDRKLPLPPRLGDLRPRAERRRSDHSPVGGFVAEAPRRSRPMAKATPARKSSAQADERTSPAALLAALRLARNPGLATMLRREELPAGMHRLIRISAGSAGADARAAHLPGADPTFLRVAAIYFLEQVLWCDGENPHRVLGLQEGASEEWISEHAWLLMEWLHPYVGSAHCEAAFAERVIDAWAELKAQDGRSAPRRLAPRIDLPLSLQHLSRR